MSTERLIRLTLGLSLITFSVSYLIALGVFGI